jgi:hypothetical protein
MPDDVGEIVSDEAVVDWDEYRPDLGYGVEGFE